MKKTSLAYLKSLLFIELCKLKNKVEESKNYIEIIGIIIEIEMIEKIRTEIEIEVNEYDKKFNESLFDRN